MRIGVTGGSFNPIHNGHIAIARAALEELALDMVLFMVAGDPPHKTIADGVNGIERYTMTELALEGEAGLFPSDIELMRGGKSYTLLTVQDLKSMYPGAEIFWIVGADMLADIPNWYEHEMLFKSVTFVGMGRPNCASVQESAKMLHERFGAMPLLSGFTGPDISSTEVRSRVFDALPIGHMLPEKVCMHIYGRGLYEPDNIVQIQEKLKSALKYKRYLHSVGVMAKSIELAERYGADGHKARLAGLLHDCAKDREDSLADELNVERGPLYGMEPPLRHGPIGAAAAREIYGVTDEEVLTAIACHTAGRMDMSLLDKIVYLSDKIDPTRYYDGVEELRALARENLDAAVLAAMEQSVEHVRKKGKKLDETVSRVMAQIREQINKTEKGALN